MAQINDDQKQDLPEYGQPEVMDYGTLLDLTEAGKVSHSDVQTGTPDTAYPSI